MQLYAHELQVPNLQGVVLYVNRKWRERHEENCGRVSFVRKDGQDLIEGPPSAALIVKSPVWLP